jgi:hypothetical protein
MAEAKAAEAAQRAQDSALQSIADFGAEYIVGRTDGAFKTPYADSGAAMQLAVDRAAEVWGNRPVTELRAKDGSQLLNHIVEISKNARYKNGMPKARGKYPGYQAAISARGLLIPLLHYIADERPEVRTDIFKQWAIHTLINSSS